MNVIRNETSELEKVQTWVLLYGRRKTGKTYLLRNSVPYDVYFHVRIDGSITNYGEGTDIDQEYLMKNLSKLLKEDKTIVIDEFQRLPERFYDDVSLLHPDGKLILTGSSLKIVNKVMSRNSPLLGMLYPLHLSIIDPIDIVRSFPEDLSLERAFELAPFLQDPWTIPLLEGNWEISSLVRAIPAIVPGLIGEVFTLEEKELSRTYEAILAMIGSGETDTKRIANVLFTRGIISNPGSNYISPYVRNMEKMGLIRQDRYWKGRGIRYSLISAPMELYHFLNSRYDLEIRQVSFSEIQPTVEMYVTRAVERFIGDLLARIHDGRIELIKRPDREIDILITKRNRPVLVAEVKWGHVNNKDISNFKGKVEDFHCEKAIFSKERFEDDEVMSLIPSDVFDMAKSLSTAPSSRSGDPHPSSRKSAAGTRDR